MFMEMYERENKLSVLHRPLLWILQNTHVLEHRIICNTILR